jgi:hypothetical protein
MPALPVPVNPSARPTCPVCCDILEDQSSIWTCLGVLGRPYLPIAGDEAPSLALCRREIQSSMSVAPSPLALQPSSPAQKGRELAAAAAAVNLAQIHLISPSCTPRPRQPRLAGLRSAECFNFTNPLTLRLGPVDRQCALFFRAWALGPSRDDPPPSEWRRMRPPPCRCSFPSTTILLWAQAKTVGDLHFRLRFEMSLNLNRPSISPNVSWSHEKPRQAQQRAGRLERNLR